LPKRRKPRLPKTRQKVKISKNSKGMKAAIKAEKSIMKAKNVRKYGILSTSYYLNYAKEKRFFQEKKRPESGRFFIGFIRQNEQ
jgi:hypothetical protein